MKSYLSIASSFAMVFLFASTSHAQMANFPLSLDLSKTIVNQAKTFPYPEVQGKIALSLTPGLECSNKKNGFFSHAVPACTLQFYPEATRPAKDCSTYPADDSSENIAPGEKVYHRMDLALSSHESVITIDQLQKDGYQATADGKITVGSYCGGLITTCDLNSNLCELHVYLFAILAG